MWRFAMGQAIGSAHQKLKAPCQDRMSCTAPAGEETLVAVICDGAGSAALAEAGADLVVTTVTSVALLGVRAGRRDYVDVIREAAALARTRLVEAATARNVPARQLACTLLAVIVAPIGGAALQLGDGAIVIGERSPAWRPVFWPQKGEYANATHFLTDDDALARAQTVLLPDEIFDLALLSDGLESLALHMGTRTAHEPFFRNAFAPLHACGEPGEAEPLSRSLSEFLASAPVRTRTDDDVSLILATRRDRPR